MVEKQTSNDGNFDPVETQFTIRLSRLDLGQLLEGFSCRQEGWQQTADWHSGKLIEFPPDFNECSNGAEAQWIADNYSRIIAIVERQIEEQI